MTKELLFSNLKLSYYPEPDSHIRNKIKVVLALNYVLVSNYATKKN